MAQKQQEKKPKVNSSFGGSNPKAMFTNVKVKPVDEILEQIERATVIEEVIRRSCGCF